MIFVISASLLLVLAIILVIFIAKWYIYIFLAAAALVLIYAIYLQWRSSRLVIPKAKEYVGPSSGFGRPLGSRSLAKGVKNSY